MFALVAIAEQAIVTGGFTLFVGARSAPEVRTRFSIEVAYFQRFESDLLQRRRVIQQLAQYTGTAFRRFVEQQLPAIIVIRQGLRRQFVVFQLKSCFDSSLQSRLQGCHLLRCDINQRLEEQAVTAVFHVGDDAALRFRKRIIFVTNVIFHCGTSIRVRYRA